MCATEPVNGISQKTSGEPCSSVELEVTTMEEEWVTVAGAPTFVVKLGGKPAPGQPLFIIIPGELRLYYHDYM